MTNEEYDAIDTYLGKNKTDTYLYTGKFAPVYMQNKKVKIVSFLPGGEEHNTCEAFIKLEGGSGGQCEWIPKKELINNLTTTKD
jgi:hypothetical protein